MATRVRIIVEVVLEREFFDKGHINIIQQAGEEAKNIVIGMLGGEPKLTLAFGAIPHEETT